MEPDHLNPPLPDDSRLEAPLRQPAPAMPDDGFSRRVLAALPGRKPARRPGLRLVFCTAGAVVGLIIAFRDVTASPEGFSGLAELGQTISGLGEIFSTPGVLLALAVTAGSLLFTRWCNPPSPARN